MGTVDVCFTLDLHKIKRNIKFLMKEGGKITRIKPGKTARSSFQIAPQIYCFWKHIKHCLTWLKTIKESFQNLSCEKQDRIKGAMLK